jgi:hypothetical protein
MMNWLTGSKHAEARKLVNQLKDASKQDRAGAELLRMGKDPDRDVQKQAIQSLGALKDSRSISALQAIALTAGIGKCQPWREKQSAPLQSTDQSAQSLS